MCLALCLRCYWIQGKPSTYNVTLRRVRVTIYAVENQKYYIFSVCVCSLIYPTCNAHAPYYIDIYGLSVCLYKMCPHYRTKVTMCGQNFAERKMCVLNLCAAAVPNIADSEKNLARCCHKFLYNKTNQMHQFHRFILPWNSTCFGQFLCPSSGVYSLYTQQWY